MTKNDTICQLNDFLKGLKPEYSKYISSQPKRIMFLLDERNFISDLSVYVDSDILKSIFDVLFKNAVKYTNKGYVKIGYRILENNILQFIVEDTGNGFDPVVLEKLNRLFTMPYSDVKKTFENLTDIDCLLKSFGGKMHIESQQGTGSVVYFSIEYKPTNDVNTKEETKTETTETQINKDLSVQSGRMNNVWEGKTILIAEDEIVNYMFLEVLLEETGAKLIHASDGQQAIDKVKANPKIDIILMDIKMPNINGLDATRQIKALHPQIPIIAQTAYAMQDDEYKALQAGCNEYISKPIDANKLIGLMKKYLR